MSTVYLLRHGRGAQRIVRQHTDVDLQALEARTRRRTIWFISDTELPEFGEHSAPTGKPPHYVIVQVARGESTRRFDRPGYWLYRSLKPRECEDILEDLAALTD